MGSSTEFGVSLANSTHFQLTLVVGRLGGHSSARFPSVVRAMEELEVFARQLRQLRKAAGLTQPEMAEQSGIAQTTLSRWEQAQSEPTLSGIRKLAQFFQCSTDVLCGLAAPPEKLRAGNWLLDVDAMERWKPGDGWAVAIPDRFRIVTSSEYQSLRDQLEGRKKR